jgi:hypothetical protein
MPKEQLRSDIMGSNGAYVISDGTLNPQHLLAKSYDLLVQWGIEDAKHGIGDLKTSILEVFKPNTDYYSTMQDAIAGDNSLFTSQYHSRCELIEYRHGDIALSPHDVWEACYSFFQNIAPDGYYFGSQEGDGACIGWFVYEDEDASDVDYADIPPATNTSL